MGLQANTGRQVVDEADRLIVQGRLPQARELLEQNGELVGAGPYHAAIGRLEEAEKKERTRAGDFQAALDSGRTARTRDAAQPALDEAERLAVTEHERLLLQHLITTWNSKVHETADAAQDEDRFQEQLNETTDILDRLENASLSTDTTAEVADLLRDAERRIQNPAARFAASNASRVRHVEAAESRDWARIRTELDHALKRAALLEELTRSALVDLGQPDPDAQVRHYASSGPASLPTPCHQIPGQKTLLTWSRKSTFGAASWTGKCSAAAGSRRFQ